MSTKSPEELNARIADLESNVRFLDNTAERWRGYSMALEADRKKLEAEVRRLTDEAGRKQGFTAPRPVSEDEAHDLHQDAQRACARRELEMTAHGMEEKSMAVYWQEKYTEAVRLFNLSIKSRNDFINKVRSLLGTDNEASYEGLLEIINLKLTERSSYLNYLNQICEAIKLAGSPHDGVYTSLPKYVKELFLESKVAADQVASLQRKLETVSTDLRHTGECFDMAIKREEALESQLKCANEETAKRGGSLEAVEQINKHLMAQNSDLLRWKSEALTVLNGLDFGAIGKELGIKLGTDVGPEILPAIRDLKAQLEGARARVLQEVQEHLEAWEGKDHFSESPLFRKSIAEIGEEILAINRGNGWDVTQPSDWPSAPEDEEDLKSMVRKLMTNLALIHSEVSEASEAVRKLDRQNFEEELADVVIRTLDTSHGLGIDLGPVICAKLKKNRGRGHKHGGKAV